MLTLIHRQDKTDKNYKTQDKQIKEHDGAPPWNGQWQKHHWGFKPVNGAPNLTLIPTMFQTHRTV